MQLFKVNFCIPVARNVRLGHSGGDQPDQSHGLRRPGDIHPHHEADAARLPEDQRHVARHPVRPHRAPVLPRHLIVLHRTALRGLTLTH